MYNRKLETSAKEMAAHNKHEVTRARDRLKEVARKKKARKA
jgi:hypothetical protein